MKKIVVGALVAALGAAPAHARSYQDGATSVWFRSLSSVYENNCCDQADCGLARSEYRDGAWWAVSNRTGDWVRIAPVQITTSVSIFPDGVLCEGDPIDAADGHVATVFCFAPPPLGF